MSGSPWITCQSSMSGSAVSARVCSRASRSRLPAASRWILRCTDSSLMQALSSSALLRNSDYCAAGVEERRSTVCPNTQRPNIGSEAAPSAEIRSEALGRRHLLRRVRREHVILASTSSMGRASSGTSSRRIGSSFLFRRCRGVPAAPRALWHFRRGVLRSPRAALPTRCMALWRSGAVVSGTLPASRPAWGRSRSSDLTGLPASGFARKSTMHCC